MTLGRLWKRRAWKAAPGDPGARGLFSPPYWGSPAVGGRWGVGGSLGLGPNSTSYWGGRRGGFSR